MSGPAAPNVRPRLEALGRWARALQLSDVPEDVVRLARSQLAHVDRRVAAVIASGVEIPESNARDAAAYAAFDGDAHVLGGRTGVGIAVLRSLSNDQALSVERVLLATVIGTEIGARVGLATLLSDRATSSSPRPGAAAGAAALAWLGGADGDGIAGAVAVAVGLVAAVPVREGTAFGTIVAEAAQAGFAATGDADHEALWQGVAEPLPEALEPPGAGVTGRWLSRGLILPELCAPVVLATVLEGVDEVLKRHVKAAEKRLRPEQVERVEVRVPFVTWAAEQARPRAAELVGRLVAFHALGPAECSGVREGPGGHAGDLAGGPVGERLRARAAEIADVASRVEIIHDWSLSVGLAESAQRWTGPLSFGRYRAIRGVLRPAGAWPSLHLSDLAALASARADRLIRAGASTPAVTPLSWPVQVKLYTTRGGWWPERRHLAEPGGREIVAPFDSPLAASAAPLLGGAMQASP